MMTKAVVSFPVAAPKPVTQAELDENRRALNREKNTKAGRWCASPSLHSLLLAS
ncbi:MULTISPECIES: hypothetical protein [Brucella]|uniref:hypothetical protein n=1 Tax=Brucella TaxID=234 RepID=UPI0002F532CB|nr:MULTISPECIES: hypothetical protein [Brucella]